MLLFLFSQLTQLLLQSFLQSFDQSLILGLDPGNLDLGSLQNFIFYLCLVAVHSLLQPLLHDVLHHPVFLVFIGLLIHLADVFAFLGVLFPPVEEGFLFVLLTEMVCQVFNLVLFLLDLSIKNIFTLRFSMQKASNYFLQRA